MGIRATAGRQRALEHQLARSVRAPELEPRHRRRGIRHGQLRGPLEHPHVARKMDGQGVHTDRERGTSRLGGLAGEPSSGEERPPLPDARARQPGERVPCPTRRDERRGESEQAVGDRVQGGVQRERRGGTRLPGEVAPAGGDPPCAPRQPLDAAARVEAERVERAFEREENPRRPGQRSVPRVCPAGVRGRVWSAAREPADERVERVEAVGVEVERQLPPCPARPPQGAGPRGDETGLGDAQRVHVQPPVGEPHPHGTRVHAGAGELRWLDDRLHRAERRHRAVAREIPS